MSYAGIVEIDTADSDTYVNKKLASNEGWELLAVTAGKEGPVYTLGRRESKKPLRIKKDVMEKTVKK